MAGIGSREGNMSVGPERYVLTVLFRCSGVAVPNGPSLRPREVIVLIVIIVYIHSNLYSYIRRFSYMLLIHVYIYAGKTLGQNSSTADSTST